MADHVRKQIRDAIKAKIDELSAVAEVFSGIAPLPDAALPGLVIKIESETSSTATKAGRLERVLPVEIEGYAQGAGVDDVLDGIALEVETAMAEFALSMLVKDVELTGTDIEITGEPILPAGMVRLSYEILYHTDKTAPDVAL